MAVNLLLYRGLHLDRGDLDQVRLTCMARAFCIIKLTRES